MKGFQHYEDDDEIWYSQYPERQIPTEPNLDLAIVMRGGKLPTINQLNIENRIPSLRDQERQNEHQQDENLPHVETVNLPDAVHSTDSSQKSMECYKMFLQNELKPATFECQQFYPPQQFYQYPYYPQQNYYYPFTYQQQQPIINTYIPPPNVYPEEEWRFEEKEDQPPQINNQIIELQLDKEEEKPVEVIQQNKTSTRDCTIKNIPTVIDIDKDEHLMSETSYIDLTSDTQLMTSSTTVSEDTAARFRMRLTDSETASEINIPARPRERKRKSNRLILMPYKVTVETRLNQENRRNMFDHIILDESLISELSMFKKIDMKQYLAIPVTISQLRMNIIYEGITYKTLYTLKLVNGEYLRGSLKIIKRSNTPSIQRLANYFDEIIPKQFNWLINSDHVRHYVEMRQKSVFES